MKKILIVDDSELVRRYANEMWKANLVDSLVAYAVNTKDLNYLFNEGIINPVDLELVLLDHELGEDSGEIVANFLRHEGCRGNIVGISSEEYLQENYCNEYLGKEMLSIYKIVEQEIIRINKEQIGLDTQVH